MREILPSGFEEGLGDEVDQMLRSGEIHNRLDQIEETPKALQHATVRAFIVKDLINPFLKFNGSQPASQTGELFCDFFEQTKEQSVAQLLSEKRRETVRNALLIGSVEMGDVLNYAQVMHDMWSQKLMKKSILDASYESDQNRAEYWTRVVNAARMAIDFKNTQMET